jgi:hypothetical protein
LYPINTHKIFDTEWFNKLTNIIEKQKEQKGKMEEMGTMPAELNRL